MRYDTRTQTYAILDIPDDDDIIAAIKRHSINALALRSGVSGATIYRFLRGEPVSGEKIERVLRAAGYEGKGE